jgi:hypothetical protein
LIESPLLDHELLDLVGEVIHHDDDSIHGMGQSR